jgi:hypothetical protein
MVDALKDQFKCLSINFLVHAFENLNVLPRVDYNRCGTLFLKSTLMMDLNKKMEKKDLFFYALANLFQF